MIIFISCFQAIYYSFIDFVYVNNEKICIYFLHSFIIRPSFTKCVLFCLLFLPSIERKGERRGSARKRESINEKCCPFSRAGSQFALTSLEFRGEYFLFTFSATASSPALACVLPLNLRRHHCSHH